METSSGGSRDLDVSMTVISSYAEGCGFNSRQMLHMQINFVLWKWHSGGTALKVGVAINGLLIGSTVSDPFYRSWLLSTASRSCTLGYFGSITLSQLDLPSLTPCS